MKKLNENRLNLISSLNISKENIEKMFNSLDISDTTRKDYIYRISLFLGFIKDNPANPDSFLEFKRYLSKRTDLAISTKNKYLATAKIFLKEMNRKGILPIDITQNIKTFSQSKKHKKEGLNEGEISKVVEYLKILPETPYNARIRAITALLTLQGLRQIEVIRLNVKDIDFVNKIAFIHGKGHDDKEPVSLHPETIKSIKEHMKVNKIGDGALFTSLSNNNKYQRLSTRALRGVIKDTLIKLDIEKSTHGFRHFFTTTLINNYDGDLLEVARFTRHKSLEMLQVYNDNIKRKADLPKYYKAFSGVSFNG